MIYDHSNCDNDGYLFVLILWSFLFKSQATFSSIEHVQCTNHVYTRATQPQD